MATTTVPRAVDPCALDPRAVDLPDDPRHTWVGSGEPWTVVHDFAFADGGAELVTRALAGDVLGGAPVRYLSGSPAVASALTPVRSRSLLPRTLVGERVHRLLTPAYPTLARGLLPVPGNVVASSYAFAHHVRCTGAKVVYCHTPLRQVWSGREAYLAGSGGRLQRAALTLSAGALRRADLAASRTADGYVATSRAVQRRIQDYYGWEDVPVVPPPVDQAVFAPHGEVDPTAADAFLWVGRVVEPYKRLGVVVEAFRGRPERLLVVGDGRDRARLEADAPPNVTFLGWRSRQELATLHRSVRAVVFPSEDDFGLVPVEAMSCGAPCLAFGRGGAVDTVADGVSGLFFDEQTVPAVRDALDRFDAASWDRAAVVEHAARFGMQRFVREMSEVVGRVAVAAHR